MGAAPACPVCDAALDLPRPACWLCRHPIPERAVSPPRTPPPAAAAVPLVAVPPPPSYGEEIQADDRSELDRTSLSIAVGLLAATGGAFGFQRGFGWLMGAAAVVPLMYLVFDFAASMRPSEEPAEPVVGRPLLPQLLRGTAVAALVIVAVPVALVISLGLACTAMAFGLSVFGIFLR